MKLQQWSFAIVVALAGCGGTGTGGATPAQPDGGSGTGQPPIDVSGCDGQALLENPYDPAAAGPWAVGARTVQVGRLTTEVWYPAPPGSAGDAATKVRYDIRKELPPSQRGLIPDADNPWQTCDCWRDLPIDDAHGPYPVVVFVHGTASFRTQSLTEMTHWASRGFVVIAADHPGLMLADTLAFVCPDAASGSQDLTGDVDALLEAARGASGQMAFLAGHVDTERMALVGHSAGGGAVAGMSGRDGVRVIMPWSAGSAVGGDDGLDAVLYVSGQNDAIAKYSGVVSAYESTTVSPRYLVGIADAGHLVVSDLCQLQNGADENMLQVAQRYNVCGTNLAGSLFDCEDFYVDGPTGWAITEYATSAVLETTLQCIDRSAALGELTSRFSDAVGEFRAD